MPVGRPTDYSDEIVEEICERLACGESMRTICNDEHMPGRATIHRWLNSHKDFETKCARARELQADYMDDLILDVANACTPESSPADRVKLSAYQWRASKLKPKKYGDYHRNEISGPDGGPVVVKADDTDRSL
jgi:hypothetical protein